MSKRKEQILKEMEELQAKNEQGNNYPKIKERWIITKKSC